MRITNSVATFSATVGNYEGTKLHGVNFAHALLGLCPLLSYCKVIKLNVGNLLVHLHLQVSALLLQRSAIIGQKICLVRNCLLPTFP